jgi:hypothetical protein
MCLHVPQGTSRHIEFTGNVPPRASRHIETHRGTFFRWLAGVTFHRLNETNETDETIGGTFRAPELCSEEILTSNRRLAPSRNFEALFGGSPGTRCHLSELGPQEILVASMQLDAIPPTFRTALKSISAQPALMEIFSDPSPSSRAVVWA